MAEIFCRARPSSIGTMILRLLLRLRKMRPRVLPIR